MTITDRIRDNKAFYAAAGAGDLAVEKLRGVPDQLTRFQERSDSEGLPGAAVAYVNHVGSRASEVFDDLAERGKRIVGRVDRQQATRELKDSASGTARKAGQTAGSARQTAQSASKAASAAGKKVGN